MSTEQETKQEKHVPESVPDDEEALLQVLTDLRVNKGKTMRQIADDTGVPLSKVGRLLKGIEPAERLGEQKEQKEQPRQPQYMPIMIRKEDAAKLYALAIDEGYDGVEDFLEKSMLPWYRVKRDFEWKLKIKIEPKQFQLYIQSCMTDSLELQQLKDQWTKQLAKKPESTTPIIAVPPGGG